MFTPIQNCQMSIIYEYASFRILLHMFLTPCVATVLQWTASGGSAQVTMVSYHFLWINFASCFLSGDETEFVSSSSDKTASVWDIGTKEVYNTHALRRQPARSFISIHRKQQFCLATQLKSAWPLDCTWGRALWLPQRPWIPQWKSGRENPQLRVCIPPSNIDGCEI